jgi:uncharacterized surface protein with fasciclin (FAS1) repeats
MRFARSPGRSRLTLIVFLGCLCFQMQGVAHAKLRGRAIGGRRIAGRGIGPRAADRVGIGRRLLRIEPPASDEACVTAYENIARRPELSELKSVVDTLPRIREKLEDPTRVFTLFTPTNDAIRRLREWEDWESAKKDLVEAFGSTRLMRAYLLSYHAIPNATYTEAELRALEGDERYLEDYLNNVMPLEIIDDDEGSFKVSGLGSDASVIESDIRSCGAILHTVDHVLLPFDGDDILNEEQVEMLLSATNALRARYGLDKLTSEQIDELRKSDDLIGALGVAIEDVPTQWTEGASDYDDDGYEENDAE